MDGNTAPKSDSQSVFFYIKIQISDSLWLKWTL